ncbi:MAG: transposase [Verrucomicrobia bacterium]|nr:MAG: transposase [Verrucomicrobiota bacterium]
MPRAVRHEYAGAVYHAMCRGNNGQDIFVNADGRRLFLSTLGEVCGQTGWRIHAYVLMSNHYHLLLETPEPNLVAGMKWFQGTYTQRFNAKFGRRGHLFQGRYKALPVEASDHSFYFREVGQYIHLNPFRAGLAGLGSDQSLEHYAWSSYPAYAGMLRKFPEWLHRDRLLSACGLVEGTSGYLARYRAMIESRMQGEAGTFSESERELVEKQLKRGWYIGGESFQDQLAEMIGGNSDNLRGQQRSAHDELEAERLLKQVLDALGLEDTGLQAMKSTHPEKQAIAWLLKKRTTVTVVWIAFRLGMGHRTSASRAISEIEHATEGEKKAARENMLQFTG